MDNVTTRRVGRPSRRDTPLRAFIRATLAARRGAMAPGPRTVAGLAIAAGVSYARLQEYGRGRAAVDDGEVMRLAVALGVGYAAVRNAADETRAAAEPRQRRTPEKESAAP